MSDWLTEATREVSERDAETDAQDETNPYLDSGIVDEDDTQIPEWLGVRWREIELKDQREALIGLRRWVEWFTDTFTLRDQVVPDCWFRHPGIIEELYAAMCLEHMVWASGEPGVAATTMWHHYLPGIIDRLTRSTTDTGCTREHGHKHREPIIPQVNEQDWEAALSTRTLHKTVEHPQEGARGVRAVVIDTDGAEAATSTPHGLAARTSNDKPVIAAKWGAATGWADEDLMLVIEHAHNVSAVRWETSDDNGETWQELDTTEQE